jgi:hypothetical protein
LRRPSTTVATYVLSDAGFTHVDTQLVQLAVDTWRTPQRVLAVHPSDTGPNVCRNGWSADAAAPRLPRPEHPETRAMPGNNGAGLTITSADRQAGQIRESHIQKSRSAVVSLGRFTERCRAPSW